MQILFIILGLIFLSSAKWNIKRGRGGKRTKDGVVHFLLGILFLSGGLIGLLGEIGFIVLLILLVVFKTPLGLAIKNQLEKIFHWVSTTNPGTQSSEIIDNQQKQIKKSTEDTFSHPAYFDFVTTEDVHNSGQKIQQNNDPKTIEDEATVKQEVILESKKESTKYIADHEYLGGSHSISRRIRITYEDRQGNITSRLVKVDSFDNHACGGSFFAYCYSRKDYRTFRFDGVIECVNEDTGEYINDIQKYLNNEYERSPQRKESEVLKKYQNMFDVFIYVAKADGQFRREEKAIILDFFANFVMDEMLTELVIEKTFKNIKIPSKSSYKYALKSVFFEHNNIFPEICRCCHEIVSTQKKITPEEEEALEIIEIVIQEEINRENKHKRKTNN